MSNFVARVYIIIVFIAGCVLPIRLFSQDKGARTSIHAWLDTCEAIRINQSGAAGNFVRLQQAATYGLKMAPADDAEDRSKFFFYQALAYYYQVSFDSAQACFYRSLHEAQKGGIVGQVVKACVALIPVNFQLQQPVRVDECKAILQSVVDTTHIKGILQDGYYALGSYYQQKSYYSTAQDYFIKSLELREPEVDTTRDIKKKFDYAILCDMLSKLYLNTEMTAESINALRQGQRFASVSPNVNNRLLSSFVEAYAMSGRIDSALYYNHQLDVETSKNPVFPSEVVSSDLNIAIYYIDHHKYSLAQPYVMRGDTIAARIGSPLLIFQAQLIGGRYYAETGQADKAIALLTSALPVAKQFSRELYASALKNMALAQKSKGNLASGLQYFQQYAVQSDSLNKEKLSVNFADQETRYQTAQKEQRIATLDRDNQLKVLELRNAAHTKWLLVLGLISVGIIALLLYFIYRNKEKLYTVLDKQNRQLGELNSQLAVANDTKARLFGIISHDLRAPIGKIVQLMQLHNESPALLDEASRQKHNEQLKVASENVLETMEDLLLWSKSQMQYFTPQPLRLSVGGVLERELAHLKPAIADRSVEVRNLVDGSFFQHTDENFVAVILRNLLQNAIGNSPMGATITVEAGGSALKITNESLTGADALNSMLGARQVSSSGSGLGLQIAGDLARSIKASIYFVQSDHSHVSAVLDWQA